MNLLLTGNKINKQVTAVTKLAIVFKKFHHAQSCYFQTVARLGSNHGHIS